MNPHTLSNSIESATLGLGMGALIAAENAKARRKAVQAHCDTTDAFTEMKNALAYERARNKALLAEIIKLREMNLQLEEFIEDNI